MSNDMERQHRLAVLIDADNARPAIVDVLIAEVAKYGVASVKRIYGDWTTPNLGGWKTVLLEHSIIPVQQFRYTVGKNATDSAMIIDAMDLRRDAKLVNLFRSAMEAGSDDSGWAQLGAVGSNIMKQAPEFDPRNYGFKKLGELVQAIKIFDVDERMQDDGKGRSIYIRDRRRRS